MSLMNNNNAFTANLYVNGLPLVLNQQRLKLRLRDPRITRRERLEVDIALADRESPKMVTVADHEDDKPLLLIFAPEGDKYIVQAVLRGAYDGFQLKIEAGTHHLSVTDGVGSYFSIRKHGVERAVYKDFDAGPVYMNLVSEENGRALYRADDKGRVHFKNVDPNTTGHNAYNNDPVSFVLKIVDKPVQD
ncbi:hypothetical protein [Pseudomonas sp.]|uniref:hypothetical protein n=1 Tax=Pseudomonas sp. TaxID=306 RepID=UPI003F36BFC2